MRGNMKVWIVVATWVWWNAVVGPAWVCSLMVAEQHTLNYQTLTFTTEDATGTSYTQFIQALRAQLASGEEPHGIPVTRRRSTVKDSQRFVLVKLSNRPSDSNVTLAVDVTNAYVVAYMNESHSFFLREDNPDRAIDNLFLRTTRYNFTFTGSYPDLEKVAAEGKKGISLGTTEGRQGISLGMKPLEQAIWELLRSNLKRGRARVARSLIVVIQMVAEAVRFRYIEDQVNQRITNKTEFQPDCLMLSLENKWQALSTAVQQSTEGGVFSHPVKLRCNSTSFLCVRNVSDTIPYLAIMLFVRRSSNRAHGVDNDDTCDDPEPTVRISGRNGLCVDVRDGQYKDGNPIQLWPCKQNLDVNQLSTLRKDGTIRSNGKCLTTKKRGCNLRLHRCRHCCHHLAIMGQWNHHQSPISTGLERRVWEQWHGTHSADQHLCLPAGLARGPGSEGQRWVLMNDGTILNLENGWVMDVRRSNPSLHQIIIWPFTGNPNQKWLPLC